MISISRSVLRSDPFKSNFSKLVNAEGLEPKTALAVVTMAKALESVLVETQKEWIELLKKFVHEEAGRFKLNEEKNDFAYFDGVNPEDAKKEIMAFLEKEEIINLDKLPLENLGAAKLSPHHLSVLEPIINTSNI